MGKIGNLKKTTPLKSKAIKTNLNHIIGKT